MKELTRPILLLLLLSFTGLWAEDTPIGYLNDGNVYRTPVYEFIDPKTQRRWLVFRMTNGNGGYNPAAVEATLTDADRARLYPQRAPKPIAPPVKNTTSYWLYATTYGPYRQSHKDAGWEQLSTGPGTLPGSTVTKLRRRNPDYVEPEGPELVLPEKP